MQNAEQVSVVRALKILVALRQNSQREAIGVAAGEDVGLHFGIDGGDIVLRKGNAKQIAAEVFDVCHRADVLGKILFRLDFDVLASLVEAIDDAEIGEADIRVIAGQSAERAVLGKTPLGEQFQTCREVYTAIDRPEIRVANDGSLGGRLSKTGN